MDEDLFKDLTNITDLLKTDITSRLQPDRDIFQANDSLLERAQFNLADNDSFLFNTRPSEQELEFLGSGGLAPSLLPALQGFRTFEFSRGQDRDRLSALIGDARTRGQSQFAQRAQEVQNEFRNRIQVAQLEQDSIRAQDASNRDSRRLDQTDRAQANTAANNAERNRISQQQADIRTAESASTVAFTEARQRQLDSETDFLEANPNARLRSGARNATVPFNQAGQGSAITELQQRIANDPDPLSRQLLQRELDNLLSGSNPTVPLPPAGANGVRNF